MIMVIFGAGASHDSIPSCPPQRTSQDADRPPLAAELFQGRFTEWVKKFPKCIPIIPYLRSIAPGKTLEQELESLREEGKTDAERLRQLAAIRFYLQSVIWHCEYRWEDFAQGITNYVTLLDQLRRVRAKNEPVLLVTFNYDRMIESSLSSVNLSISEFQHYIQNDAFRLFKLHGSVNWVREVENQVINISEFNDW